MATSKTPEILAEIAALKARVSDLESKLAAPRPRGPWQPSESFKAARAEFLKRKAAGENVVIVAGKCVLAQ